MANFKSTEETARATAGVLADKRYGVSIPKLLPFNWTVPASPGAAPTVNLATAPAGFKPRSVFYSTNGLSASGGVGLNVRIGDAGDDDRLMADVDSDAAVVSHNLAAAGYDYEYTADTVIVATVTAGKTPVAGQKISGYILGSVRE